MQHYLIHYVARLKARMEPGDVSIADALKAELPEMDRLLIFKLLAAADDLTRILQLELQRRDDEHEARELQRDGGAQFEAAQNQGIDY